VVDISRGRIKSFFHRYTGASVMSFRHACALVLTLGLVLTARDAIRAEEKPEWTPPKPGKEHKILAKEVGEWDAAVKVWEKPAAKPMESKGKETNRMLGDFWLVSRFEGELAGMPFVGGGAFGYDPVKKKFVGIWIDSMSPHQMTFVGDYDEDTETMTSMGEGFDLQTNKPCKTKMISRFTGDDTRVMEMHMQGDDGKFSKTMEITYTRRN
jgi:hypothetical protein